MLEMSQWVLAETVALLTRQSQEMSIGLEFDCKDFDLSRIRRKVAYQEIKKYIEIKTGQKIHSAYIAQVMS